MKVTRLYFAGKAFDVICTLADGTKTVFEVREEGSYSLFPIIEVRATLTPSGEVGVALAWSAQTNKDLPFLRATTDVCGWAIEKVEAIEAEGVAFLARTQAAHAKKWSDGTCTLTV